MARIFITGASGMVGRNLLDELAGTGHEVLAPSSASVNLLDQAALLAWLQANRPDVIVHCAGHVGGIQAYSADPVGFLSKNADMGMNIVLASMAAGVQRLLNLGSSCMYPRAAPNPLREEMVLNGALEPTNEGYAIAKIVTARLCDYVSRTNPGLTYRTVIPCNIFGLYDKFDPKVSHLLPAIIRKIHDAREQGHEAVEIWGDGTARREFMFAGDLADGVWTAVARFDDLPEMMNMGVGADHSINDYYETAARVIGWEGRFVHDLSKPTGMKQKLVAVERQAAFGWMPATSLESGIAQTYAHFLSLHI